MKIKIDKEKLYKLYMDRVDHICETCDWVTEFGPKEIVWMIAHEIQQNPDIIQIENEN